MDYNDEINEKNEGEFNKKNGKPSGGDLRRRRRKVGVPVVDQLKNAPEGGKMPLIENLTDRDRVREWFDRCLYKTAAVCFKDECDNDEWFQAKITLDCILAFRIHLCGSKDIPQEMDGIIDLTNALKTEILKEEKN